MISTNAIQTTLSIFAITISIISLVFSRRSWLESNRPIITAFIQEHASGNMLATFNLVVSNTGNRPATNIFINAKERDIMSLLDESASDEKKTRIKNCFSNKSKIPLLRNGEELKTAFGAFSSSRSENPWLNYEKEIAIEIGYNDLDGRIYCSRMPLKIYAREGFGGSVWSSNPK
jgi:hypothetical protein